MVRIQWSLMISLSEIVSQSSVIGDFAVVVFLQLGSFFEYISNKFVFHEF